MAVEAGIKYKRLYETQQSTIAMYDSLLSDCREYAQTKPITITETKTNWLATGIITALAVMIQSAITLLIIK